MKCHKCKLKIGKAFLTQHDLVWHVDCYLDRFRQPQEFDIISIAKKMYNTQQNYFKTRDKAVLNESRKLEAEFKECAEWYKPCPMCKREGLSEIGMSFIHCNFCGYCLHPSLSGGVCDICGKAEEY